VAADPVPKHIDVASMPVEEPPAVDPVEPAAIVEEPVELTPLTPTGAMHAALEAPGHQVGDVIEGKVQRGDSGLFQCGVDKFGRVWRFDEGDYDGVRLILAGRLQT
jgi:uncharacterized protein involved in high-affinity Fe2+ transport